MLTSICSDAACWDATGSMMQGWAAWAAVAAVIYAAKRAADTFGSYRRQKQEDRRIDAAERILTVAYKIKSNLESARSPMASGGEHYEADQLLNESDAYRQADDAEKRQAQTGHIILLRIDRYKETWETVFSTMPLARALFGEAAEAHLLTMWRQVRAAQVGAQMYRDRMGTNDPNFRAQLERDMWSMGGPDAERNPIALAIDQAITALEGIMLPIIRADHECRRPRRWFWRRSTDQGDPPAAR